ncbi:MAG: 2,3-bisphosphoglycerate-dependent phosphoglycerate mutase [Intrasporangium sp.]
MLVRHGESTWNASDRFTGWVDVPLTEVGRGEARTIGRWLHGRGIVPTVVHSSLLVRARSTAQLILAECRARSVPVLETARLNERHYGALQGMTRSDAVVRFGAEQVARWRRGPVDERPPTDEDGRGESLADVRLRQGPYIEDELLPAVEAGHTVLVVSHSNALRMLVQRLEGVSDEEVVTIELPTGAARVYDRISDLRRVG